MATKRIWKSAVARALVLEHKKKPTPAPIGDRIIAQAQKGISANGCAALLAKRLHQSVSSSDTHLPHQVDLAEVCRSIGLEVQYRPLTLHGLLQETKSGYLAVINSVDKPSRQRMSLAHEIGHLVLYRETHMTQAFGHITLEERKTNEAVEIELLCDHFASELVMPTDDWETLIKAEGLSLTTLNKLKKRFGVSITDAADATTRAAEVALLNSGIILWKPILENEIVVAMRPIKIWGNLRLGAKFLEQTLPRNIEALIPGSPFYAWENKVLTAGKISLSMTGSVRYLAQSDVVQSTHVITLLLPERTGWEVMFR